MYPRVYCYYHIVLVEQSDHNKTYARSPYTIGAFFGPVFRIEDTVVAVTPIETQFS
jgi:hypothetical protein